MKSFSVTIQMKAAEPHFPAMLFVFLCEVFLTFVSLDFGRFDFSSFSDIVVPLQSAMTVTLPSGPGSHLGHNPFPGSLACIAGFEDTVKTNN